MRRRISRATLFSLAATTLIAAGPPSTQPALTALRGLQQGEWELRPRAKGDAPTRLCLGDPRQLLQVGHPRTTCRSFVVSDSESGATVTYDCAGTGGGRTDIRVETPRLIQLRAQGVSAGAPFVQEMEGRRIGACSGRRVAPSSKAQ